MTEPLPILIENSVQIAWDYLERAGEITQPGKASNFVLKEITTWSLKVNDEKSCCPTKRSSHSSNSTANQKAAA
jgi:hypothetical protein